MTAYELIRSKRDGLALPAGALSALLEEYARGRVPDYQMAALCMAVFFRGLSPDELRAWTLAMLRSGETLDLSQLPGRKVDKHSTGGVGDKVSLVLAPLVAACGARVPSISGRGLGHTGGTLDKLAAIPGFRTDLSLTEARDVVAEVGLCFAGQTESLAPADRRLYALRDVTATVDCIPLIASSILSKKLAEDLDGLVLDVKVGSGAFMKRREDARALARVLVDLAASLGCPAVAWLTDMDAPLGRAVGNALEVNEAVEVLSGRGPPEVRELSLALGAEMLCLVGLSPGSGEARSRLESALGEGHGLDRLRAVVRRQGGDPEALARPLPVAPERTDVAAPRDGVLSGIDTEALGRAAVLLGAGRLRAEDAIDTGVGFTLLRTRGQVVRRGEPLLAIHHRAGVDLAEVLARVEGAFRLGDSAPPAPPLLLERLEARA
ncbi:MAG TPA: thymidine phosphorylase [Myxococcaceae bacterium]|nr:thymidine phosphorylase [Myxococcaceae bacterium]